MVTANVLNTYTTAAGLWQYDYGQILTTCKESKTCRPHVEITFFTVESVVERLLQELEQQETDVTDVGNSGQHA